VQFTDPQAILYVCLSAGHMLYMPAIDNRHFYTNISEHVIQYNPVNTGGFHGMATEVTECCCRYSTTLWQPLVKVSKLFTSAFNAHKELTAAYIYTGTLCLYFL
jgi:hypothetical protein